MILLTHAISITFTLSDLLILTGIICLIIFTIYLVLTLKSLIAFLKQTTELMEESSKVIEDVQEKSKALDIFVQDVVSNGKGVFKIISALKR